MTPNRYVWSLFREPDLEDVCLSEKRAASRVVNYVNRRFSRKPRRWPVVLAVTLLLIGCSALALYGSTTYNFWCDHECNEYFVGNNGFGGTLNGKASYFDYIPGITRNAIAGIEWSCQEGAILRASGLETACEECDWVRTRINVFEGPLLVAYMDTLNESGEITPDSWVSEDVQAYCSIAMQ